MKQPGSCIVDKDRLLSVKDLPTLPKVLQDASRLVEDATSSTEKIAKVISMDQVLSAKVLRMVNSPVYGFPGRIGSVQHALVLLGFNVIRGIIISTTVFDMMARSMVGLWEHSLGCATACASVAKAVGVNDPEEYAVAGLLHDIGKVVLAIQQPEAMRAVEKAVAEDDLTMYEAERKLIGFGHDRINLWLSTHWNLPLNLKEALAYHHRPKQAQHYPELAAVVHVGDFLVRSCDFGYGGDSNVPYLEPESVKLLGLTPARFEAVLDELRDRLLEIGDYSFA